MNYYRLVASITSQPLFSHSKICSKQTALSATNCSYSVVFGQGKLDEPANVACLRTSNGSPTSLASVGQGALHDDGESCSKNSGFSSQFGDSHADHPVY